MIEPMLAVPGEIPTAPGWAYEFKWDGVRTVAYTDARGGIRLRSRNDLDVTASYPELGVVADLVGRRRVVLDGEIVTFDKRGVSSFSALQRRMHVVSPSPALISGTPVVYGVFDVLFLDEPLTSRPWHERRAVLEDLGIDEQPILVAPYFETDPDAVMATARERGLEGVVSKRVDGTYHPGRRSPVWLKTPFIQTTEVVVVGWKPGAGRRAGTIGSLVLGAYDEQDKLAYCGGVGTGFTDDMLDELLALLGPLETDRSPLAYEIPTADRRGVRWVRPRVVGEVVFRSVTPEGRLRHPAWRGLRPDRRPREARLPHP
ncbi:non-homologous end-joining DNA ligase [Asanoa sp. NPDC050611]|uniref:non-homologous end-joining DNA ligase n=1 Tax=Asanoa sp. NPDC050611 TaxID=3157098 RepID=UPI0033D7725A